VKPSHTNNLAFYATRPHPCSYLPGREAVTLFADPSVPIDTGLYSQLIAYGFRRSGEHIYRPRCPQCEACIPIRIPVENFRPSRAQRRAWRRNQDLDIRPVESAFNQEHYRLYRRYVASRHKGGGMDDTEPARYMEFLTSPGVDTRFCEFRWNGQLIAVAVYDQLHQGLSAVYTFFDPEFKARGLGVYAVLWEIQEARHLRLPWLYLGYWIEQCPKMRYKNHYRPCEFYTNGQWVIGGL